MTAAPAAALWPYPGVRRAAVARWAGITGFAVLTALGAQVRVPLPGTPVPFTLQTLFVLWGGCYLGGRDGALAQFLYLVGGSLGFPLFAGGGGGMLHLAGPTGGYLLGFVIAAWFVGHALGKNTAPGVPRMTGILLAGTGLIHLLGLMHLSWYLGIGLKESISLAIVPFLPGDGLKVSVLLVGMHTQIKSGSTRSGVPAFR